MLPIIFAFAGTVLSDDERALFRACDPAGFILFRRNIETPDQVRALTDSLRELSGRSDLPILIDQEGGRVARLEPPHWPVFPTGEAFGRLFETAPLSALEAARVNALAIALTLRDIGVTVDCLPLLDVPVPSAHDVIGDRAYGREPLRVAALGDMTLRGLREGGVVGIVKHIPGHGRAAADSHLELPVVTASRDELETDFAPFRKLSGAPMGMTAHVKYTALDAERCASLSPTVIEGTIRGDIGFDGFLMADDLGMKALGGSFAQRALGTIAAGCDVALHCSGVFAEMAEIAEAAPAMSDKAQERLARAMAWADGASQADIAELAAKRDALLALAA
ncbi:beta-N-acetylhexosaminidase [Sphingoaurantiacus capsulatus]|uniref:beta-N-acetylhexosaminidase n=1 Tax=Sphingoaurantiacus capsulatus TaxID=1771310 RepID=A0ABV7XCT8_9SPHN